MLNLTNTSIKNKLISIQVLTAILTIVLCGAFFVFSSYRVFEDHERESLQSIATAVGSNVTAALDFVYVEAAQSELGDLNIHPQIMDAAIFDADSALFADYHKDKENRYAFTYPKNMSADIADLFYSETENDHLNLYYKLVSDGDFSGILCMRVLMSQTSSAILVQFMNQVAMIALVIGVLVALVFALFFQKTISHPLTTLIGSMKQVSQNQDYSVRMTYSGTDEIAELSRVFNSMLEQIEERDSSLREAHNQLEQRVKERTEQLNEKKEALERSNQSLEQFAYVASHDLQEPLRMIGSFSQLIARRYKNTIDPEIQEYIHYIVDGVGRMQKLIRDLLDFSRVGTREVNLEPIDMSVIMLKCMSNLRYSIEESQAEVICDDMPVIAADKTKMLQLFQNLISNAIKFNRPNVPPKVHIKIAETPTHWQFQVKDNGIGIEQEYAEKIFLIFQRLHTSEYPGTGIGLAICKKIVEMHNGTIDFESTLGEGTTFIFTIQKVIIEEIKPQTADSTKLLEHSH